MDAVIRAARLPGPASFALGQVDFHSFWDLNLFPQRQEGAYNGEKPPGGAGGQDVGSSSIFEMIMAYDLFDKDVLIFGCGNTLLGDDGFGPGVIEYLLEHCELPPSVLAMDVGTGIRGILFDLMLTPTKPRKLIVIDAVDSPGRVPGEVFEIPVEGMPAAKVPDFSLHQFPAVHLLEELKEHSGMDVRILVVQIESIPEEVRPGLSGPVAQAVPRACKYLREEML